VHADFYNNNDHGLPDFSLTEHQLLPVVVSKAESKSDTSYNCVALRQPPLSPGDSGVFWKEKRMWDMLKRFRLMLLLTLLPALPEAAAEPVVRVGGYESPPKLLMGEDGLPSGIHGDLLRKIAQAEGWQLRSVRCEWEHCLACLKTDNIDLLPDAAYSVSRKHSTGFPSGAGPV
jgi:hypothetical protein